MGRHLQSTDPVIAFHLYPMALVELLQAEGIPLEAILADTGLEPHVVQDDKASISYTQYGLLIRNAFRHFPRPGLGLHFGSTLHIGHQGMLGMAVMTSSTLREAARLTERYYKFLSPALVLEMREEGGECVVQANEAWDLGPVRPFALECVCVALLRTLRFILGVDDFPCQVELGYPPPPYVDLYPTLMPAPVSFRSGFHRIRFDAALLDRPLRFRHALTCSQAVGVLEEWSLTLSSRDSVLMKLRQIPVVSPGRVLSLEEAAARLFMSERTLKRQLHKLNTQYRKVVDTMRFEWAASALRSTHLSVAEVAEQMCFSDVANFRRAFKRWSGLTPQDYRGGQASV